MEQNCEGAYGNKTVLIHVVQIYIGTLVIASDWPGKAKEEI